MSIPSIMLALVVLLSAYAWWRSLKPSWVLPKAPFPGPWRVILKRYVSFYNALSPEERKRFEYKVQEFLLNYRITGIGTEVDDTDRILVAASGIIPIFGFDDWRYAGLSEILVYPTVFDEDFNTEGGDRRIAGMVGEGGAMDSMMILSQRALRHGFQHETDDDNTAIHEFVHLIDKADGEVDGIPALLLEKQYTIPWLDLIHKEIDKIYDGQSDIDPYAVTNRAEFFAVASEFFFERPKLMESKHPELYAILEKIFKQDMSAKKLGNRIRIRRNAPCPCDSKKKFKKCCGQLHYSDAVKHEKHLYRH